jgi:hypothetical protein
MRLIVSENISFSKPLRKLSNIYRINMDELDLLCIGAVIALVSSILSSVISAIVTHTLSLRYDKVRRERDQQDRIDEEENARKQEVNAELINYALRYPDEFRRIREKVIENEAKSQKEEQKKD